MAENRSWESSPDQASTPLPLHSTSSESIEISPSSPPQLLNVDIQGRAPTRLTLEETLLTCLTQLPHSTAVKPSPTTSSGRALSEPIRAAPASPLRQSRSSGTTSTTTSTPAALSPSNSRPTKRRSRASRRVPTMVVEATFNDFRETVHRLTGIATPTPAPVRPQPTRVNPTTLVRPVPQIPSNSNSNSGAGWLHGRAAAAPSPPPAFWQQTLQQITRASEQPPHVDQPFVSSSKSEPRLDGTIRPAMGTSQLGSHSFGSETTATTMTTQAVTAASAWWDVDAAAREQAQSYFMNPSSEEQLFQIVDPELSIDQWFHQDHSGSDFMR